MAWALLTLPPATQSLPIVYRTGAIVKARQGL